ncbi:MULTISPECIES: hypothetical protein [unclassified Arthrobacter]|uniref:hypothetical protein n=1 Tax=unclassified Arthrobacter TaxID=235627 RepID=UPI00115F5E12|nr:MULTISPECIES: hypothetical protein [unclassified Arthrobacter]TQS92094.1 hypothetical protein EU811_13660 [Arthrobacter sp. TS-15]BCW06815.1 hypothetical protein NtRootA1_29530 [Arthrobacter sp. NtRootA1]
MKKAHGLRRYFYEYVFYKAVEQAREQSGEIIPISQAKAIRGRVDQILGQRGTALADPGLGVTACLTAIDTAFSERVPDYEPQFGDHSPANERYQTLQREFTRATGVGAEIDPRSARLPISPYDPAWSERATVKRAGTELLYIPDETIVKNAGGEVESLSEPRRGNMTLWRLDEDGKPYEAGRAMTNDDAAGLTALMDKMSRQEYDQVREWVIDGGRDPQTGRVDRNRFMSQRAEARSAALLEELKSQGVAYEVLRDREPGQIKARISGTGMEIRLTDTRQEEYAGARIYDNGTVLRYSTNHRVPGGMAVPAPTSEDAVRLLRFAQGLPIERDDLPGTVVGVVGSSHPEHGRGRSLIDVPDSYHVDRESMFVVADYIVPGESAPRPGSKVMLRRDAKNRSLPTFFVDAEPAEAYGREAVDTARENLRAALGVEELILRAESELQRTEGALDEIEPPEYASDPEVAAIQRSYWDVLTGARSELLRPGATEEMYQERLEEIGELQAGELPDLGNLVYGGTAADKVRAHADDVPFELVGTWDAEPHLIDGEWLDQRFDPARVAKYMTSPTGQWSNLDNLASALRRCGVPPTELMGTSFQATRFKDRIVSFHAATAAPIAEHPSEFMRRIGQTVRESIERNAATPGEILVDAQGVISWTAEKLRRDGKATPVSGEIGQVFDVGSHGEIVTRFASGENALIVPGYEARIKAQTPGEAPKSVEERTVLRGYEQLMHERIQYQLAGDLVSGRSRTGEPASLNAVYSQLYGTKHPVDFIERATTYEVDPATGKATARLDEWTASILETEAKRVRYSNEIKQGSTIYAEYRAERDRTDPADDNVFDAWRLTGGRNMTVLTGTDRNHVTAPGGFFDPVMTGGATNQGIVRYLTEDAAVRPDGTIEPGDPETVTGSRAPLMSRPELETLRYDPFDRQQMTASTIMQSSEVTKPTGTALMTFGGWTADDPIVVSTEFSERHRIRGAGGQLRDLVVGDKISDLHGNKGVVSLVVDRHMDPDEARAQGLEQEVAWFGENPGIDVVMSPFSLISRRNAGSARELMGGAVGDIRRPAVQGPEAGPVDGGLGEMRFVVTHMAVDEKTKIYDDEQVRAGKGRKASSQLAWALQSQDCPAIMREFYGHNSGAESNLREYLLVAGLDMEADGTLRVVGQAESVDERPERRLIPMPELMRTQPRSEGATPGLNTTAMRKSFGDLIGDRGGDMEIPFPLTYPTGQLTETVSATSWKLPVLSSHLRSGQEFDDGTSVTHDYTRSYQDVFVEACRYRYMAEQLDDHGLSPDKRAEVRRGMSESVSRAQRAFEAITTDVQNRVLTGKNNIFKTGLMSSRLSDSATMVWTADPRLDIDQIALSSVKAEQLGLAEGDHALVWRDPVLRDAGVRYMRVAIDDRLTGAAINPVMDQCFDGDFDGDAVAVVRLHSEAAKAEAMARLSVGANLLDTGVVKADGSHPLAMQVSLDTQVALSKNPELAESLESAVKEANRLRFVSDPHEVAAGHEVLVEELSDLYRSAQRGEFGSALTFSSREAHLQSVREVCVETGAKGSEKKLGDYARNLGDEQGTPGITQEDQEASMFATAIKAHGTGLGGSFSQRAVRALRGADLKAVLEVTYPVTQSILQAKHDAAEARHKYEMLQGPGRDLWRGRKLEHTGPGQWRPEFADGEAVQATAEEWEAQFVEFYEAKDGFNVSVNPDCVARVARALEDPKSGLVRNLEEDPSLAGTVMDRMAYGGDFEALVQAAKNRESVFDGEKNEQFASAGTRRARAAAARELDAFAAHGLDGLDGLDSAEAAVDASVLKRDVLAQTGDGAARARGASRRSAHAVGVGGRHPAWTPSYETGQQQSDDDYGLGG